MAVRRLVDANVWLALVLREHVHHDSARAWFRKRAVNEAGMCRHVQLTLLRVLQNRSMLRSGVMTGGEAWNLVDELLLDERVDFVCEPEPLPRHMPQTFNYRRSSTKLVGDAFLAAFAMAGGMKLTTYDRGFRQFPGLELELLNH